MTPSLSVIAAGQTLCAQDTMDVRLPISRRIVRSPGQSCSVTSTSAGFRRTIPDHYRRCMRIRRVLVVVSTAQLLAGVAGQVLALRDRRSFDITLLRWRGRPERVARDSWLLGTGLSAPVAMLVTQAIATVRLAAGPSQVATRTLGGLGATMACGYLIEREFRVALSPGGGGWVVTPVAAAGFSLALVMGGLGLRGAVKT